MLIKTFLSGVFTLVFRETIKINFNNTVSEDSQTGWPSFS